MKASLQTLRVEQSVFFNSLEHQLISSLPVEERKTHFDTVSDRKLSFGGFKVETLGPETLKGSS